jgi:hypothetical protein
LIAEEESNILRVKRRGNVNTNSWGDSDSQFKIKRNLKTKKLIKIGGSE